jgi:hypothetical protein
MQRLRQLERRFASPFFAQIPGLELHMNTQDAKRDEHQSDSDAGCNIPFHMLISLSFSEHDYPNRLPGFGKQCTSMICQDDSDDDVLMVQDTDPGLPPHDHALPSDSDAGYNIPFVSHTCSFLCPFQNTTTQIGCPALANSAPA